MVVIRSNHPKLYQVLSLRYLHISQLVDPNRLAQPENESHESVMQRTKHSVRLSLRSRLLIRSHVRTIAHHDSLNLHMAHSLSLFLGSLILSKTHTSVGGSSSAYSNPS